MSEKRLDLYIYKGNSFSKTETWSSETDLSEDYSAIMHIKYSVYEEDPIVLLSSENGISLGRDGSITISMTPEQTNKFEEYSAVYDMKVIKNDGTMFTTFWGSVKIMPQITKL